MSVANGTILVVRGQKTRDIDLIWLGIVTIIGVETVLVLAYAIWIGEGFSMRQAMGGLMVLAGLAIVSH